MNNKDINEMVEQEVEVVTEFSASETTLGGSGQYKEAGIGRFL